MLPIAAPASAQVGGHPCVLTATGGCLPGQGGIFSRPPGAAGDEAAITITADQAEAIQRLILAGQATAVDAFGLTVRLGLAVPAGVPLQACPSAVTALVADLRGAGCAYFLIADGRIVIARPATRRAILVLAP